MSELNKRRRFADSAQSAQSGTRKPSRRYTGTLRLVLLLSGSLLGPCTPAAMEPEGGDVLSTPHTVQTTDGALALLPIPVPDLSSVEQAVQQDLRSSRAEVVRQFQSGNVDPVSLANALGILCEHYQAHHIYPPAEPCYRNAERLDPQNFRWPHLLGYLGQQTTQHDLAVQAFQRSRSLEPEYEASRVRLAETYIGLNQPDKAEALLGVPFDERGVKAAVLFSRGRIALARRDFDAAVGYFEQALAAQPDASRIHSPLAMAYRGKGDVEKAREHLARYGDGKPNIVDPVVDGLDELLTGKRTQLHRGLVAVQTGQYEAAIDAFAGALEGDPDNVDLRVSLARSLYLAGRHAEGRQQLAEALRRDPAHPLSNFLMGVLLAADNDNDAAIARFETALANDPEHAGAQHYLADTLVREGRYAEAVPHYSVAIRQVPKDLPARVMEAVSLLYSGGPQTEAAKRLESLYSEQPQQMVFTYMLARLLAASPDDGVRDGSRALSLAESLYQQLPLAENAETLAMAYAELGRFDDAREMQQQAMGIAMFSGRVDLVPRLKSALDRYQDNETFRIPFAADDPMLRPIPVDPALPFRDYPASNPY